MNAAKSWTSVALAAALCAVSSAAVAQIAPPVGKVVPGVKAPGTVCGSPESGAPSTLTYEITIPAGYQGADIEVHTAGLGEAVQSSLLAFIADPKGGLVELLGLWGKDHLGVRVTTSEEKVVHLVIKATKTGACVGYYVTVTLIPQPRSFLGKVWAYVTDPGDGPVVCEPDAFEGAKGNNTPASATPLTIPAALSATICAGDTDYFSLPVPSNCAVEVAIQFNEKLPIIGIPLTEQDISDLSLGVFTAYGAPIDESAGSGSFEALVIPAGTGGTVLIAVYGADDKQTGPYSLTVNTTCKASTLELKMGLATKDAPAGK